MSYVKYSCINHARTQPRCYLASTTFTSTVGFVFHVGYDRIYCKVSEISTRIIQSHTLSQSQTIKASSERAWLQMISLVNQQQYDGQANKSGGLFQGLAFPCSDHLIRDDFLLVMITNGSFSFILRFGSWLA